MEAASTPPNGSAPATPGTPAPLFVGPRVDSMSYDRKSMPRCKCLPAMEATWGVANHTCVLEIPAPDISLTRKVRLHAHDGHVHSCASFLSTYLFFSKDR
jgi:aquaporin NIP